MANRPSNAAVRDARWSQRQQAKELAPLVTGKNEDGSDFFEPLPFAEWAQASAAADNATASTVKSAPGAGKALYVTGVSAFFDDAAPTPKVCELREGAAAIQKFAVSGSQPLNVDFARPIKIAENTACELNLPASGTLGQNGYVSLRGYTL